MVIVTGGAGTAGGALPLTSVLLYDPLAGGGWTRLGPSGMLQSRAGHGCVVLHDERGRGAEVMMVAGGWGEAGTPTSVEVLSLRQPGKGWTRMPDLNRNRCV